MKRAVVHISVFCNDQRKLGLWQEIEETNIPTTKRMFRTVRTRAKAKQSTH